MALSKLSLTEDNKNVSECNRTGTKKQRKNQDIKFCYYNKVLITNEWYKIAKELLLFLSPDDEQAPVITWDDIDNYSSISNKNGVYKLPEVECNNFSTDLLCIKALGDIRSKFYEVEHLIQIQREIGKEWYSMPKQLIKRKHNLEKLLFQAEYNVNTLIAARHNVWRNMSYCLNGLQDRYGLDFYVEHMSDKMEYEPFFNMVTFLKDIVNTFEKYIEENNWFKSYVVLNDWIYDGIEITQNDYDEANFIDKIISKYLNDKDTAVSTIEVDNMSAFEAYCRLENASVETLKKYGKRVFGLCSKFKFSAEVELIHLHNYLSFIKDKYLSIRDNISLNKYVFEKNLSYKPKIDYFYEAQKQDFGIDLIDLNALDF